MNAIQEARRKARRKELRNVTWIEVVLLVTYLLLVAPLIHGMG